MRLSFIASKTCPEFAAALSAKVGAARGYRGPARPFTTLDASEIERARAFYRAWRAARQPAKAAPAPKARRSRSKKANA